MPRRRVRRRERPIHRKIRDSMDYDALFKEQEGKCAICGNEWKPINSKTGRKNRRMHRDHNHQKLYGRGLLCYSCNVRLRGDVSSEWCEAAARYLRKYEELNER